MEWEHWVLKNYNTLCYEVWVMVGPIKWAYLIPISGKIKVHVKTSAPVETLKVITSFIKQVDDGETRIMIDEDKFYRVTAGEGGKINIYLGEKKVIF